MALYFGTLDGLYRAPDVDVTTVEKVLDGPSEPYNVRAQETLYARSSGELYRSTDDGHTWTHVETPSERVTALLQSPDDDALYLGTYPPAELSVSHDGGDSWSPLDAFPRFPPVRRYFPEDDETRVIREHGGSIHDLQTHPDAPHRLIAGVEPQGCVVSTDRGESWTVRRAGLHGDVHDIEFLGPETALVATGQGLYRTTDAGETWDRLDRSQTYFEYTYFHGVIEHDGRVFTAAAAGSPGNWSGELGVNAVLLEATTGEYEFEHVSFPGGPEEFPIGWTSVDDRVLAGTMAQDWDAEGTSEARVLERTPDGEWTTLGSVPAGVITMTSK